MILCKSFSMDLKTNFHRSRFTVPPSSYDFAFHLRSLPMLGTQGRFRPLVTEGHPRKGLCLANPAVPWLVTASTVVFCYVGMKAHSRMINNWLVCECHFCEGHLKRLEIGIRNRPRNRHSRQNNGIK